MITLIPGLLNGFNIFPSYKFTATFNFQTSFLHFFPHEEEVSRLTAVGTGIWVSLLYSPIRPVTENSRRGVGVSRLFAASLRPCAAPQASPGATREAAHLSRTRHHHCPLSPGRHGGRHRLGPDPERHEKGSRQGPGRAAFLPPAAARRPTTRRQVPTYRRAPGRSRLLRGGGRKSRLCGAGDWPEAVPIRLLAWEPDALWRGSGPPGRAAAWPTRSPPSAARALTGVSGALVSTEGRPQEFPLRAAAMSLLPPPLGFQGPCLGTAAVSPPPP